MCHSRQVNLRRIRSADNAIKYYQNISKGIKVMERTEMLLWTDGQTDAILSAISHKPMSGYKNKRNKLNPQTVARLLTLLS